MPAAVKKSLALLAAGVLLGWGSASWVRWARQQLLQWLWPLGPLKLERPLVAFDIESTGLNVSKDRILEIAAVKVWPAGKVEVKGPQRLNPKVHIPAEVIAIHHITQEDLVGCPGFADVAQEWREFLEGCDLAGYNAKKFDVPILRNEFRRAGQYNFPPLGVPVVDAFRIFCQQEPRTLSAAVGFYCGRLHSKTDAHSALGDAWATLKVLVEQVRRYGDLPRSASQLSVLCSKPGRDQDITPDSKFQWRGDLPVVAFGKYSGEPLGVLIARHKDHLMWMSGQDWGDESLMLVAQALKGLIPTKQGGWQPVFDTPAPQPSHTATAAAANGGSSSIRHSSRAQHQQQQQGEVGAIQKEACQQQEQQQPVASSSNGSAEPQPAAAAEAATETTAAAGAAGPGQQRPKREPNIRIEKPPPAEFTGWPDLSADSAATVQNADSWGAPPTAVADGWEGVEAVAYGSNPGPQTPAAEGETEGWGESTAEVGAWQQQEEGEGEGEGGFWEEDEQQQGERGQCEDHQQQQQQEEGRGWDSNAHENGHWEQQQQEEGEGGGSNDVQQGGGQQQAAVEQPGQQQGQ